MNAAFLLVTSAWLTGQAPATPAPATKPAPAAAAPAATAAPMAASGSCSGGCGSSCGSSCDSCCDSCGGKHGLLSRFGGGGGGLFHRNKGCCDTCNTCAAPTCNTCNTCCDDGCGKHGGGGLLSRFGGHKNKGCGCDCGTTATACCDDGCGKHGGGRLGGLFHRNKGCCDTCDSCGSGCATGGCATGGYGASPAGAPTGIKPEPIPAPKGDAPKKMPGTTGAAPITAPPMKQVQIINEVEQPKTSLNLGTETNNNPFELHRRYESRVTHAPDYSSLTGQLFYVHADGGLWILRYAPLSHEDTYGGSIVLARDLRMDSYREGDLVTVHGQILAQKGSVFLGGPLYRASTIELIDREAK